MEQYRYEGKTQNICDSKGKSVSDGVKTEISPSHAAAQSERYEGKDLPCATPTPEKTAQPSRSKSKLTVSAVKLFSKKNQNEDDENELGDTISDREENMFSEATAEVRKVEIPEKYKPLAELFDRIDTSIRLLSLREKLPTFQNICPMVKVLTNRVLSYKHVAQIKYLLPEAIQIEKVLTHDERTLCMIPDMKITLLLDVIEANPNQSTSMALRQVFHERLLGFINSHSESCEVPEAVLPEPFNQRDQSIIPRPSSVSSSIESHTAAIQSEPLLVSSIGQSIKKQFSGKTTVHESEKTQLLASPVSCVSETRGGDETDSKSPSVKLASFPVRTPVQPVPERKSLELSSCEKMSIETRMSSHTATKRSLTFDESKKCIIAKDCLTDDNITAARLAFAQAVKENMNQSGRVKRQQMLASLADFVNTIQHIFKSSNGTLITKQELLQKIIAEDLDIINICQAEEQLELLEEVVPDWTARKSVPNGDLLYSIRKVSDLESIRARLSQVV